MNTVQQQQQQKKVPAWKCEIERKKRNTGTQQREMQTI